MRFAHNLLLGAAAIVVGSAAMAQDSSMPPDPGHIPFILPANIPWKGTDAPCNDPKAPCPNGDQTYMAFGDTRKPGIYGQFVKWGPGHFSTPHMHNKPRYIVVVSGTWWVSSSNKWDMSTLYPLPAGTIAQDIPNTVHWDGAKAGGPPAIIEIVGEGPVDTASVDEEGKPIPPKPRPPADAPPPGATPDR